ncbi:VTT domain-containing protein [Streptomyces sp. NPDC046831]|uniref:DedA family protein n=1 Tax=Streptomyces sp. NPDC046831 TaxID=3154805 RepID=UPI003406A5BE
MTTLALGPSWLDPNYLLDTFGLWGLLLIVFAESGLLIGFFLPGDSLLFTCGLLITSNQLDFPLWGAIALICAAAILGDQAGYMFGKKVGPSLFSRPDSRLFKQENVTKAHEFFEKYGPKSLVLARFVPIVRTFTPIIAGVSGMRYRSFLTFNILGGVLWGAGVTLLGSWLGNIALVKNNIEAILILIVLVSVVPIIIEFWRARSKAKKNPGEGPAPDRQRPAQHQQPVLDDATTRLRRIEPAYQDQPHQGQDRAYGDDRYPQQHQQHPQYGYDQQYYGGRQHPQEPQHPRHQHPQQPQDGGPYGGGPYGSPEEYGGQYQQDPQQYPHPTDPQQYPQQEQDPRQYPHGQGYYRAP